MMAGSWYVRSDGESRGLVTSTVGALCPGATVAYEGTAQGLRDRLLASEPGVVSAAVGPGACEVDPVNLAAALARDGHAREVVLVVDAASGSLRSRAARAGVDRVLDREEAEQLVRSARTPPARPGQGRDDWQTAEDDMGDGMGPLDDPDFGDRLPEGARRADSSPRHLHAQEGGGSVPRLVQRNDGAAPIVVVASGRGGVGKSTLVSVMACAAASWGMRVAVVDLDLCSGNLFGYFGLPETARLDVIDDMDEPGEDALASLGVLAAEGVTLWGPCQRPEMAETISPHVADLLACASNRSDLVIVDTSTTWTDAVAEAVQGCDRLLLVGDERAGTVSAMSRSAALAVRLGVARTRIARVTNRSDPRRREEPFLFRADIGLETARSFSVIDGSDEVAECLSAGQVAQLATEAGEFSSSVASMLAKVLEEVGALPDDKRARAARDWEPSRRQRGLFSRMREAS